MYTLEKWLRGESGKATLFALAAAVLYACATPLSKRLLESLPQFFAGANVIVVHSFSPFDSQKNNPRTLLFFSGLPPPWGFLAGAGTEGAAARSRSCAASDF